MKRATASDRYAAGRPAFAAGYQSWITSDLGCLACWFAPSAIDQRHRTCADMERTRRSRDVKPTRSRRCACEHERPEKT